MNTVEMVKAAGSVQSKSLAEILAGIKKGDVKAMAAALKTGAIAARIVKKGSAIVENADKYEAAAEQVRVSETSELPQAAKSNDALAVAESLTRYSVAVRRSSALRKLEAEFGRIS